MELESLLYPISFDNRYKKEKRHINGEVAKLLIQTSMTIDEISEELGLTSVQVRRKQAYICAMLGVDRGRIGLKTVYIELLEEK